MSSKKQAYQGGDLQIMKNARLSLNRKLDRVDEIIAYAKQARIKKIGIATCVSLLKESEQLEAILVKEGFEVQRIHCKEGKLTFSNLQLDFKGIACDPVGQAKFLEDHQTELNIVTGLCVGHDMIFNGKSKAPTTNLIVKDRVLKHKSIQRFEYESR